MSTIKVSQLTTKTLPDAADELLITDTSGSIDVSKKVVISTLPFSATTHVHDPSSATLAGTMSAAHYEKLEALSSGTEANVQVDWNQANEFTDGVSNDDYIKNKPTIPSVPGVADADTDGLMAKGDFTKLGNIDTDANKYVLPAASGTVLGGFKVGTNLSITDGVLSATDSNTQYSVGDGGLTKNNFTDDDHTKLDGIDTDANKYIHPTANHIPANGESGKILSWSAAGTAAWSSPTDYSHLTSDGNKHPPAGGTSGHVLSTNGAGVYTWVAQSGGGVDGSDDVANESAVTGTTTSDALDTLYGYIFPPTLSSLNFNGRSTYKELGTSYSSPTLTWSQSGGVSGQVVTSLANEHSDGNINASVADNATSYISSKTFSRSNPGTISWKVTSNNGTKQTSAYSTWVKASYSGKNTTGSTPSEAQIEAGTKLITSNTGSIYFPSPNTSDNDYGWFAIDKNVSQKTTWWTDSLNTAPIGTGEFIENVGVVGDYRVYIFGWKSAVSVPILFY